MAILSKGTDFTTGEQVTAARLDALVDNATFASGAVDGSTTQLNGTGAIIVKDGGITSAKLNLTDGVTITDNTVFLTFNNTSQDVGFIGTDVGTGNFFINAGGSTDELVFKTDGSARVTIKSDGDVGIGTTSPDGNLHVVGATGDKGRIFLADADNGSGQADSLALVKDGVNASVVNRDGGYLQLGANNSHFVTLSSGGQVGIGATPSSILDITQASGVAEINLNATQNDAVLSLNSDTDEGSDSEIHFNAGTSTRGKIEYNHHATASSQKMSFFAGDNNERLTILGNGNVGIGTTSPDGKLHIGTGNDSDGTDLDIVIGGDTANQRQSIIRKKIQSSDKSLEIIASGNTSTNDIKFFSGTGSNETVRIKAGGNVGIGTSDPDEKLEVRGATLVSDDGAGDFVKQSVSGTSSALSLGAVQTTTSGGIVKLEYDRSTGKFHNYIGPDAGTNYMTVTGTGNVGLGTDGASEKLDVNGNINTSGNITVAGNVTADYVIGAEDNNSLLLMSDPQAPDGTSGGSLIQLFSADSGTASQHYQRATYHHFGDLGGNNNLVVDTVNDQVDVTGRLEFDALKGTGSTEVTNILAEDNMSSNSASALATQRSIKAYVDTYAAQVPGSPTGTFNLTSNTFVDVNLSSKVGSNKALVVMEVFAGSDTSGSTSRKNLYFRQKGSSVIIDRDDSKAGAGCSACVIKADSNAADRRGGVITIVTDSAGKIEGYSQDANLSNVNFNILSYQVLRT